MTINQENTPPASDLRAICASWKSGVISGQEAMFQVAASLATVPPVTAAEQPTGDLTDEQLRGTAGYRLGWMEGMQEGAELATGGEKTAADVEAEFADLLPGSYYMDPPDGGSPSVLEQVGRMAEDAAQWRAHLARQSPAPEPVEVAQEVTQQAAKAETAEQAFRLVQKLSCISMRLAADLVQGAGYTFKGHDYLDRDFVCERVVQWRTEWDATMPARSELASRFRAQGGNTNAESSDLAPTASTVSAPEAPACTCPSGDGSLRWPCPRHPPKDTTASASTELILPPLPAPSARLYEQNGYRRASVLPGPGDALYTAEQVRQAQRDAYELGQQSQKARIMHLTHERDMARACIDGRTAGTGKENT